MGLNGSTYEITGKDIPLVVLPIEKYILGLRAFNKRYKRPCIDVETYINTYLKYLRYFPKHEEAIQHFMDRIQMDTDTIYDTGFKESEHRDMRDGLVEIYSILVSNGMYTKGDLDERKVGLSSYVIDGWLNDVTPVFRFEHIFDIDGGLTTDPIVYWP